MAAADERRGFEADVLMTACGQLSIPKRPTIDGLESFAGPVFHTAEWRHDVDLTGKRVAVIGTGCSAIQTVPAIQPTVEQLDIYQRSPGWTMPKMDFAYSERTKRLFERFPALQRLDRMAMFAFMDIGAAGMTSQRWLLAPFRAAGRQQIKKAIKDGELRAKSHPGRRGRLQADHAHRRVVSDARKAQRRADHRTHRTGHSDRHQIRRRRRAARRRDRARDRL